MRLPRDSVLLVGAALLLVGCRGQEPLGGELPEAGESGPPAPCTVGAACPTTDVCDGGVAACPSCQCVDGTWQNPCPEQPPSAGSACSPPGAKCSYTSAPDPDTNRCGVENCDCYYDLPWTCSPECPGDAGTCSVDGGVGATCPESIDAFCAEGGLGARTAPFFCHHDWPSVLPPPCSEVAPVVGVTTCGSFRVIGAEPPEGPHASWFYDTVTGKLVAYAYDQPPPVSCFAGPDCLVLPPCGATQIVQCADGPGGSGDAGSSSALDAGGD